ncbi:hypothetical protein BIY27_01420 [Gibbsiella quercinecans]|nr:hypothetical protein BIY27_01420 [Gibbsiella quercinecans]
MFKVIFQQIAAIQQYITRQQAMHNAAGMHLILRESHHFDFADAGNHAARQPLIDTARSQEICQRPRAFIAIGNHAVAFHQ